MNATTAPHSLVFYLAFAVLIAWRLYARVRRLVGRQRLSPVRPWATLVIFPLLLLALGLSPTGSLETLAALGAGLALGVGLGVYGHRKTLFEIKPDGLFYTPSAHIGLALSALFIGRLAYRLAQLYSLGEAGTSGAMASGPITLAIFSTMAGYYMSYAVGLLRWRNSLSRP